MLTVVLPNFNHARFLPESLEALLAQTRQADELIIIDDASTDESVFVISSFLQRHANARLLRNATNQGIVRNLNYGLELAQGDIVCFPAADDVTRPELFRIGIAMLAAYPQAAFFSARSDVIDAAGRNLGVLATPCPLREPGFLDSAAAARHLMHDDGWFTANTILFRRDALRAVGGFPEDLYSFADGYILRLLALKHGACFSPEILGSWRRLEGSVSWSQTANLRKAVELTNLVEKKMAGADSVFPAGYAARWRRRYLFGAQRLILTQERRNSSASVLLYSVVLVKEAICTAWLLVTLRPWDIATILRRRFAYSFQHRRRKRP